MNARDSRRDSRRHRFVIGPAISSDSNESGEFAEINRWGAGLPGLRFQSIELISGDFKRFKGDLARFDIENFRAGASKPFVRSIGNHLRNETGKAGDTFSKQSRTRFKARLTTVCYRISDVN